MKIPLKQDYEHFKHQFFDLVKIYSKFESDYFIFLYIQERLDESNESLTRFIEFCLGQFNLYRFELILILLIILANVTNIQYFLFNFDMLSAVVRIQNRRVLLYFATQGSVIQGMTNSKSAFEI